MINYLSVGRSPFVQEVPFYIRKKKVSYSHRKFKEMRDLNVPVAEVAQTL